MDPTVLPEEVWTKIFTYCGVSDILAVGSTCRYLRKASEADYLWKGKWQKIIERVPFKFPDVKCLQSLGVNFKGACLRVRKIVYKGEAVVFPKCLHCGGYTCQRNCVESSGAKIVTEIGNKYTWIITPYFGLRRHLSLLGLPQEEDLTPMRSGPVNPIPHSNRIPVPMDVLLAYHLNQVKLQQSTGQFRSRSSLLPMPAKVPRPSGPFCVFCNPVKLFREKKRLVSHSPNKAYCGDDLSLFQNLFNGYGADTVCLLGIPNVDIVSPTEAFRYECFFPVAKTYVDHLCRQMNLLPALRKPNAILMFCEPLDIDCELRKRLLQFLFEEIKVARVCLVPKPLAACSMLDIETCIVIDSGALSTTVSVILNGRVLPRRWKLVPVGGWHVAYYLKELITRHQKKYSDIPVSYFDSVAVKEKCKIIYSNEMPKPNGQRETIRLKADIYLDYKQYWKVSVGPELYLAPETMYKKLRLPELIQEATAGLSEDVMHECLSHILLTGGNTDLSGFDLRLAKDLKEAMPEYTHIIDVKSCPGAHSWNVAMGSTYVPLKVHPDKTPPEYEEGSPFWLSREEFILFGVEPLEQ